MEKDSEKIIGEGMERKKSRFDLIVITTPDFFPGEAACLESLLTAGLENLHIRKPLAKEEEVEALLLQLSPCWRPRIVLQGQWGLADRYAMPRRHLRLKEWREMEVRRGEDEIIISTSLHGWEESGELSVWRGYGPRLDYAYMSPVFDSLSKPGYRADTRLLNRPAGTCPCRLIGLGGVQPDTIGLLIDKGWDGAAVLGWLWSDPQSVLERYKQLVNIIGQGS